MSPRRLVACAALLGGAVLGARAGWIPAKAVLAQALLQRAWDRACAGDERPRAWPWADTSPVARLEVAELGVRLLVLEGADGSTLAFGPGHVAGTAAPGEDGHVVVAGHRDTHFAFLRDVRMGTRLGVVTRDGARRDYVVESARVVHRTDGRVLSEPAPGLSLVTCWPLDAPSAGGPWRWVVTARPVEEGRHAAAPLRQSPVPASLIAASEPASFTVVAERVRTASSIAAPTRE